MVDTNGFGVPDGVHFGFLMPARQSMIPEMSPRPGHERG